MKKARSNSPYDINVKTFVFTLFYFAFSYLIYYLATIELYGSNELIAIIEIFFGAPIATVFLFSYELGLLYGFIIASTIFMLYWFVFYRLYILYRNKRMSKGSTTSKI